jgi:hypothetical protein
MSRNIQHKTVHIAWKNLEQRKYFTFCVRNKYILLFNKHYFYSTNGNTCSSYGSWVILVCGVTSLRTGQPRMWFNCWQGQENFFILQSVLTSSGAHLVPYSVGTWGSFFGWGVKLATRLHLMANKNEWSCAFTARTGIPSSI